MTNRKRGLRPFFYLVRLGAAPEFRSAFFTDGFASEHHQGTVLYQYHSPDIRKMIICI